MAIEIRGTLKPGELFFLPGPGIVTSHRPESRDPTPAPPPPPSDDDGNDDQDIASVVEHRS